MRAQADTGVVPDTVTILALPAPEPKALAAKTVRTNSVLVVLMTFTDSGATPFTQAQVQNVFATGSASVTEFFREASYGQQLLNATITPWLPTNSATPANCNFQTMGQLGRSAATAAGYNTASYQNLVYVFPAVAACGWAGLAYIGASGVWINGRNLSMAYAHELGHNFGLLHAGSVRCSAGAIGGSCTVTEYGDPFDTMGNLSTMHYNAPQKLALGWIANASVVTHSTGTATYTLSPLELAGGTTYAIKVPTPNANRTYWVEYRQPLGFDAALASYPNNGAQVRVASPFETLCANCDGYSNDTQLLDMTPSTSSFTDAALLAGRSYTDATYGLRIDVVSATSTALTVQVSAPGGSPTPTPTTTTLASSANPASAGASVTFTATVTGTSPAGTVSFADSGTTIAGCSAIVLGGTGNARTVACTTSALVAGTHSIVASYSGDTANAASSSSALSQVINATSGGATPANAGFETPYLGGSYQYGPAGATWVFANGSGITGNGNAFTSGNPNAPEGVQVAFLQGYGSTATQSLALNAGQYVLSFYAAQRSSYQSGTQIVRVQVDGVTVGQYQPPGATFTSYQSAPFSVATGGSHTITLMGTGSGSDFTAFIDRVQVSASTASTSTTSLASSANPASAGASLTLTASVSGTSPTGTVSFTDGGTAIAGCATASLAGTGNTRTAACTTSSLAAGTHSIVAAYGGDSANAASTSATLMQTVNGASGTSLANAGFESPSVSGSYQYDPVTPNWIFSGPAGVTGNGSAFTSGNPTAPEGAQVAFLQQAGSMAQSASLAAGQYVLGFAAAQRANYQAGTQIVRVQVDGVTIGQYQPPGITYSSYQTAAFTIATTGTHTITLGGVGSGSDFTAFVDDVRLTPSTATPSGTALASSDNPSTAGASITFTASVTGASPSGVVAFTDNGAAMSACAVVALAGSGNTRTAACTTSTLGAGTHDIVATYAGDGVNAGSASTALAQVVNSVAGASIANAGFETPNVGGGYQYLPSGASWLFASSAGLTGNNSGFTSGNPAAPEGSQVLFLQNGGAVAQSATLSAGRYVLGFQAAQRGNYQIGTQVVLVQINGVIVGQYQPTGTSYTAYQTLPFALTTTGNYTIALTGVGTGSDYTAFIDAVTLTPSP